MARQSSYLDEVAQLEVLATHRRGLPCGRPDAETTLHRLLLTEGALERVISH